MKLERSIAIWAAALISVAPAYAQFHQGASVTLDNKPVFNVAGCDGMSAGHRAWVTQDRLDNALFLSDNKGPSAVTVGKTNGAFQVFISGRSVITADACSAKEEGCSPEALANKWAGAIRDFLSNSSEAQPYIASLKRPNPLGADVAVVERQLFAPAGTVMPITFQTALNSATARAGDRVEGVISQDVMLGNYAIPSGSLVIGELVERRPGELGVVLDTLRLKSGTEYPISASVVDTYLVSSESAHPVCTMGMPANEQLNCRIPATVGIGTVGSGVGQTTLVLRQDTSRVIASGSQFSVVLDSVTPVAVVTGDHAM